MTCLSINRLSRLLLIALLFFAPQFCEAKVILGDERSEVYLPLLEEKRVALFSNHSGIVGDRAEGLLYPALEEVDEQSCLAAFGTPAPGENVVYGPHIADFLLEKQIDLKFIFSPEHGFRGNADYGEGVDSGVDGKTGLAIYSLYGRRSWKLEEKLAEIDVLVVDIQDVGLRYYTYYITMMELMNGCAKTGTLMLLLDRPNPNGFYCGGPVLDMAFKSGVGALPIASVHGLTLGELALMINGEGWLEGGRQCPLKVVECLGYEHNMHLSLLKAPSPNLKDMKAVYLYASTCWFEGTDISLGRGTDYPFEVYGAPCLKGDYSFTPESMEGAKNPPHKGELCFGKSLRDKPLSEIWEKGANLTYILETYSEYPEKDNYFIGGGRFFDLLTGNSYTREMIISGAESSAIYSRWKKELDAYAQLRNKY
ncbi:MAG: exo-beta-N-acetylmuramidase NamZ domain-containing protein, partial [Candidatus Cryptobacteroides sp.]